MADPIRPISVTLKWRLECLLFISISKFISLIPIKTTFWLGERLGALAWFLYPSRRNTVIRNLRIAYANERSHQEILDLAKQSFARAGANLFSSCRTCNLSTDQLGHALKVKNSHILTDALKDGHGVVLLIAHMGNWEVITRVPLLLPPGIKGGSFYRPLSNQFLDDLILKRRQMDGTRMFSKRDPFHDIVKFLRDGGVVGILADQRISMQGEHALFFNRLTRCSPLPALIAKRSKSSMVAMSLSTTQPGEWLATFHHVQQPYNTQNCVQAVEYIMRSSPIDVFWPHDRWKVHFKKKLTITDWLGENPPADEKPRRCLVWLLDTPPSWCPPPAWIHPAVSYEAILPPHAPTPEWLPPSSTIHHSPPLASAKETLAAIQSIDLQQPLPLDFILTHSRVSPFLKKSARALTITIAAVP